MKKLNVKNNVFLIAQESWKGCRKLDYYLILKNGKKYYAFSRDYSRRCHILCQGESQLRPIGLAFLRPSWYNKNSLDGGKSAPLRWLCGIQEIMSTFSRPLTEKRRLPRKPTYQASKQAASQGRCVNGLTPTGDGNVERI